MPYGIDFSGDLMLRADFQNFDAPTRKRNHRGRFRLRFNFEKKLNDQWKAFAQVTTRRNHPTVPLQELRDDLKPSDFGIRQMGVRYKNDRWDLSAGRNPVPFKTVHTTWDPDAWLDGFTQRYKGETYTLNLAQARITNRRVLPEDATLLAAQVGRPLPGGLTAYVALYNYEADDFDYRFADSLLNWRAPTKFPIDITLHAARNLTDDIHHRRNTFGTVIQFGDLKRQHHRVALLWARIETQAALFGFVNPVLGPGDVEMRGLRYAWRVSSKFTAQLNAYDANGLFDDTRGTDRIQLDAVVKF